jgi:hypothetical protein
MCGLGIVCDDLNALKIDVDRFMSAASNDYALIVARAHFAELRVDNLEKQLS